MNTYDLVISLGSACPVASALKQLKITEKTYPLDWSDCDGTPDERLLKKCECINNHFADAFNIEDFIEHYENNPTNRCIKNTKTGLHYWHDFPWNKSVKEMFPEFLEKYQRRVTRLYEDIKNSENILFIYQDLTGALSIDAIKKAISILKKSFKNKNINLLVCLSTPSKEICSYKLNMNNVYIITCFKMYYPQYSHAQIDYNIAKTIAHFFKQDYYSFFHEKDIPQTGLSQIETFGRWSCENTVFFRLKTHSKQNTVSVDINVIPFIFPPQRNVQTCKIFCNGYKIKDITFDTSNEQKINLKCTNDNDGNLDFVFEFDNPASPKELGLSEDNRKIALAFVDAKIS